MTKENELKTSAFAGPLDAKSPTESPTDVPALSDVADAPPEYQWKGEGPPPPKWWAADGTLVYRSYADYCMD